MKIPFFPLFDVIFRRRTVCALPRYSLANLPNAGQELPCPRFFSVSKRGPPLSHQADTDIYGVVTSSAEQRADGIRDTRKLCVHMAMLLLVIRTCLHSATDLSSFLFPSCSNTLRRLPGAQLCAGLRCRQSFSLSPSVTL